MSWGIVLLFCSVSAIALEDRTSEMVEEVARIVSQLLVNFGTCHLVLLSPTNETSILTSVARYLSQSDIGVTIMEATQSLHQVEGQVAEGYWRQTSQDSCEGLFLDLSFCGREEALHENSSSLLNVSGVATVPGTFILAVGPLGRMEVLLQHPSLLNSPHAFYLALDDTIMDALHASRWRNLKKKDIRGELALFSRCLYCDYGEPRMTLLRRWKFHDNIPLVLNMWDDKKDNLMGHEFKILALPYYPYIEYDNISLRLTKSLALQIITAIAGHLNFTYSLQEPLDGQWGILKDGKWSGIVRDLQDQRADFTLSLTPTYDRSKVIDFSRIYMGEPIVILSAKPQILPNYMSLVRPFSEKVWIIVSLSVLASSIALWLLQRAWAFCTGGRGLSLSSVLMYTWGILMEESPNELTVSVSGRLIMATWFTYCIVITTGYRSSLVAHLTVQGKTPVINALEDLLKYEGWAWGITLKDGAMRNYIMANSDPVIQKLAEKIEFQLLHKGISLALEGNYGYINAKYYLLAGIKRNHTDKTGYSNAYFSKTEYNPYLGVAWAFRKGHPLRNEVVRLTQRLIEAGLVDHWMDEMLAVPQDGKATHGQRGEDHEVLRVEHFLGAFVLLFLGLTMALFTFILEFVISRYANN